MTFNVQTFKTRAITAVIFAAIMLGGLFLHPWAFFLLFTLVHFGCWLEYQQLVGLIDKGYQEITVYHKYGVMLAGWCLMLWFSHDSYNLFGLRLHELGWWLGLMFVFLLPLSELLFSKNIRPKNIFHSVFGLIYISLSFGLMMDLYVPNPAIHFPAIIIFSIWINDTMAYIVGSLIGRTPLTKISPKKTWEGTIGGIILAVLIIGFGSIYLFDFSKSVADFHWFAIPAIAAVSGTFGDLLESKMKRLAGVKDSGHLMPGHGGMLDRFDSLLVAIPFVWLYVTLFLR